MWKFGDGTCGLRKKKRKTWLDVEQMKTPTPDPGCSLSPEENQEFLLSPVGLGPGNLPGKDGSLRKTDTSNTKLVSGGLCTRMEMHQQQARHSEHLLEMARTRRRVRESGILCKDTRSSVIRKLRRESPAHIAFRKGSSLSISILVPKKALPFTWI